MMLRIVTLLLFTPVLLLILTAFKTEVEAVQSPPSLVFTPTLDNIEAAISSHMVIAEKSARFGLPEVLFNLIPGMGAYSFLTRLVGRRRAEKMILSAEMRLCRSQGWSTTTSVGEANAATPRTISTP